MRVKITNAYCTETHVDKFPHIIGSIRELSLITGSSARLKHIDSDACRHTTDVEKVWIDGDKVVVFTKNTCYETKLVTTID
jgi:hypothetical protein